MHAPCAPCESNKDVSLLGLFDIFILQRLAQLGVRRYAEREAVGSNPGRTSTQGLEITEEKVLPL